jgi:hypothetical protein
MNDRDPRFESAEFYPRVPCINEMVALIEILIAKGVATKPKTVRFISRSLNSRAMVN